MRVQRPISIAVTYSPAAAELVRAGRIAVDAFNCPDGLHLLETASRLLPVCVSFPPRAGRLRGRVVDLDDVAERLFQTRTPHVNVRLDPQIDPADGIMNGLYRAIERALGDVRALVAHFGSDRVVVENVPYFRDRRVHDHLAADPAFIRQVVEECRCGFLLDLAHARMAAHAMDMEDREYLSLLPVEHLRALHVSGILSDAGGLLSHTALADDDWALLAWILENVRWAGWGWPRVVVFKYGGVGPRFKNRTDPAVLAWQVPHLVQAVRDLESAGSQRLRPPVQAAAR